MKRDKLFIRIVAIAVFSISIILATVIIYQSEQKRLDIEGQQALFLAVEHASKIEILIERALHNVYIIEALIQQGNGEVENFESLAEEMLQRYSGMYSIALVPNGIVSHFAPMKGNEKAIGHNLFQDPARVAEATYARDTGKLTFSGPFITVQGPVAAFGRLPVFLADQQGKDHFWGFVAVGMRFPEVLESAHLSELESHGYAYQLWRIHPDTGEKHIIIESDAEMLFNPIIQNIQVPNATWYLSVSPLNGWSNKAGLYIEIILALTISILFSLLIRFMMALSYKKRELEQLALTDYLTGLPNRRLLTERLNEAILHSKQMNTMVAVCYLDLDGFKRVNDLFGHKAGDSLLIEVSKRFVNCFRENDTISRFGGDEFLFILQDLKDVEECKIVLNRIMSEVGMPFLINGNIVNISTSLGVAFYPQDSSTPDVLIRYADQAMYEAKNKGKGMYCFFNQN